MNEREPLSELSETSGRRQTESSPDSGRRAVRELDGLLELRGRIAACLDEIDACDPLIAAANLELLIRDLDGAAV